MKARKRVVVAFLAAVVLGLGVGFAALTDELLNDGTVNANTGDFSGAFNENIFFSTPALAASTVTGETGANASVSGNGAVIDASKDKLTVTINAGTFSAVGQVMKATAKIENSSTTNDASVAVTASKANAAAETTGLTGLTQTVTIGSFDVTITLSAATVSKNTSSTNGEIDVTVEIKVMQLPAENETNTFQFKITATAV